MKTKELSNLFEKGFEGLKHEIALYRKEEDLWITCCNVNNSAGNLAIHICGSINHFVNHGIGNTPYKRDRNVEFSQKDLSQKQILQTIEKTKANTLKTIKNINPKKLEENFPLESPFGEISSSAAIVILLGHLQYHLGQISYHRRLLEHPESL